MLRYSLEHYGIQGLLAQLLLNVADALGLKPIGKVKVYHANGEAMTNVYLINVYLPNQVAFPVVRVTEGILNGFDVLIGMDIITTGDFSITNVGGNTTFSFRVPSIKEIDYHAEMKPSKYGQQNLGIPKVGRNDQCPCGSGKKYKLCHGR